MGARGKVYLIGAGPGDIGLMTVKGLRALQECDVVVYDFHLNAQVLNYINHDAEFVYAGKRGGHHEMSQEEINKILVDRAKKGLTVCRLKGGDPFVFGRGGEEVQVLSREGIEFEVIPGVSSAIAVPAYAGIPLTHREYASSFLVVPGSEAHTKEESTIDWDILARWKGTLVFLMAVSNLRTVTGKLIEGGKAPDTPVAVIRWGTRADQKTLISTLDRVADDVAANEIKPPAVVVVGEVVKLRDQLNWFEKKPLFGHRVLVTRPSTEGYTRLESLGAELIEFPTIEVVPPTDWSELDRAIEMIDKYHWIVFTSQNGVKYFFHRFYEKDRDIRDLAGIKLCAIGEKTGAALRAMGLRVDLVPEEFNAEGLVEAFQRQGGLKGKRILLPRAEKAREVFPEAVRQAGGQIDTPVAYRARKPTTHGKRLQRFLREGRITIATFTSGATFKNFLEIMGESPEVLLKDVIIAAIGPVTRNTIEKTGLKVHVMPDRATVEDMVNAIIEYLIYKGGKGDIA